MSYWRRILREIEQERQRVRPLRDYRAFPASFDTGTYTPGDQMLTIGPPAYRGWEVLALHWEIEPMMGDVYPIINVLNRQGEVVLPVMLPPVAMGDSMFLYLFQGGAFGVQNVATFTGTVYPLPLDGELKDEQLQLQLLGGAAGDAHRAIVYYEEFDWPYQER